MSNQSRASVAELTAEFERAMGSLADTPVASTDSDARLLEAFVRIAAIALEGAARLRRGT